MREFGTSRPTCVSSDGGGPHTQTPAGRTGTAPPRWSGSRSRESPPPSSDVFAKLSRLSNLSLPLLCIYSQQTFLLSAASFPDILQGRVLSGEVRIE